MPDRYTELLLSKARSHQASGFEIPDEWIPVDAKPFQRAIIRWSGRQGRSAIFASTGLGKTLMSSTWASAVARKTEKPVLLFCPIAVGPQTIREAEKFGIDNVKMAASQDDVTIPGVYVTNYQKLHKFDPATFGGVVLGESSILKNFTGTTRKALQSAFDKTPYKLCETATPAPNDHMELGQHAEFLGVMRANEMLSRWFINDQAHAGEYRIKEHGKEDFWRWVSSWACCLVLPSDLGFDDEGYILPKLHMHHEVVKVDVLEDAGDCLLRSESLSATTLHREMRKTARERAVKVAEIVRQFPDEPFLIWCNADYEQDELEDLIPDAVSIRGSTTEAKKIDGMIGFSEGRYPRLITKPSIAGHGMNWQHCRLEAFVGLSYSFEAIFQALRRCWRFGQTQEVHAFMVQAETEGEVAAVYQAKSRQFDDMRAAMVRAAKAYWSETSSPLLAGTHLGDRKPTFPKWLKSQFKGQPAVSQYRPIFSQGA